jgi:hypothetical protein
MSSPLLWHYTCSHGRADIGESGLLLPIATQAAMGREIDRGMIPPYAAPLLCMVWATDMDNPEPEPLGLTRDTTPCDRTAYRYAAPADAFTHWGRVRGRLHPRLVDGLELARGAEPARWWVAFGPVPAVLSVLSREVTP